MTVVSPKYLRIIVCLALFIESISTISLASMYLHIYILLSLYMHLRTHIDLLEMYGKWACIHEFHYHSVTISVLTNVKTWHNSPCVSGISTTHINRDNRCSPHMVVGNCKYGLREIDSKYDHLRRNLKVCKVANRVLSYEHPSKFQVWFIQKQMTTGPFNERSQLSISY